MEKQQNGFMPNATLDSDSVNLSTINESQLVIDIVDKQLAAYNNRDIEAFLATYHDDIEIYDFPNTLRFKGKEALKTSYGSKFAALKSLKAISLNRIVEGRFLTDHEQVYGCEHHVDDISYKLNVTVTYEVVEGLIKRVIFFK